MERKSIGAFIAVLRKAQGLTQRELAEKLNVSDKTVSRWERDEGCPDLALIPVLAEIFSVSCDELLRGERQAQEQGAQAAPAGGGRGEKQRKYLLAAALSRFINSSYVAQLLALLGLTAAAAVNFGFGRGRLGFFLGLGFFLVSALCQLIFRNKALASAGEPEDEEQGGYRLTVLHRTELSLSLNLVLFSAVLPLLSLEYDNAALLAGSWLAWGGALAAGAAGLCCIVCWLLNGYLRKKPEYGAGERAERVYRINHRLRGRLGLALAVLFVFTGLAHYSLTRIWGPGTIMEGIEFEDLNSFAEFMEKEEGVPLDGSGYSAKFYDEQGNEISPQEANRRYLTDGNGNVVLEYVQNNRTVCSVQAKFQGDELLELKAYTYEELARAKSIAGQRHIIFAAVYGLELAALMGLYYKKRLK